MTYFEINKSELQLFQNNLNWCLEENLEKHQMTGQKFIHQLAARKKKHLDWLIYGQGEKYSRAQKKIKANKELSLRIKYTIY